MRRPSGGIAQAEIDGRLAKVRRQQLPVTIGEMQQMHVAEARHIVDVGCVLRCGATTCQREARSGCRGEELQEFEAIHVDLRRSALNDAESLRSRKSHG